MDPTTLIITALSAGATLVAQGALSEATKDAYQNLKSLVERKFTNKPDAKFVLTKHQEKPQVWEEPLKDALLEVQADKDSQIYQAATYLLAVTAYQGIANTSYNNRFLGNIGAVLQGGASHQVTINQTTPSNPKWETCNIIPECHESSRSRIFKAKVIRSTGSEIIDSTSDMPLVPWDDQIAVRDQLIARLISIGWEIVQDDPASGKCTLQRRID